MYNDQKNDCFELVLNVFFTQFSPITKKWKETQDYCMERLISMYDK